MQTFIHLKTDLKQIMRDPIMAIMLVAPLLLIIVFKFIVLFLLPFVHAQTGLDISIYSEYLLSFVVLTNSGMLGIVTGFLMLDERDGNIVELMSVTPLGKGGYLLNRLLLASILSVFYTMAACQVLNIVDLPVTAVLALSVLSALYAAIIGLLLFLGASDKVKGLTYAKALNALILFAFADLFSLKWLTVVAWFFPPYWFTVIIKNPLSLTTYAFAFFVHSAWLLIFLSRFKRKV